MGPEKIAEAASKLVQAIEDQRGSREETNLSGLTSGAPTYKPFYGACSVLVAPTHTFRKDVLDDKVPTLEEAMAICQAAHQWYDEAISQDPAHFKSVYDIVVYSWGREDPMSEQE